MSALEKTGHRNGADRPYQAGRSKHWVKISGAALFAWLGGDRSTTIRKSSGLPGLRTIKRGSDNKLDRDR
jgi:hypothetical protein